VAACLLAAAVSAIVIGALALSRRASAQAPDEGLLVPADTALSDDIFGIGADTEVFWLPEDTDLIGLPGDGMMLGGPPVHVQIVHPDGRNWAFSVDGATLTASGVPSGGTYTWSASGGSATFNPQGSTYGTTSMAVAEPGSYTPAVVYTKSGQGANAQRGTIVALEADLQMDGLNEAQEEDPGGYLGVGGPRRRVTLNYAPSQPLQCHQLGVYPTYGLEIYACETGGEPVTVLSWDDRPPPQGQSNWAQRPSELWVEGTTVSSAPRQEAVTLGYTGWAEANVGSDSDTVVVTVVDVNLELQGVAEENEEDPGGFVAVNSDDDDGAVIDKDDTNGVVGENDMVHLVIHQVLPNTLPPTDKVKLTWAPDAKVDVFENADKTSPIESGKEYTLSQLPKTLYVEGDEVSGAVHDVQFDLTYTKGNSTVTDTVNLTVYAVEDLTWEPYPGNAQLDPKDGGRRIFPDCVSVNDSYAGDRPKVQIKATVTPTAEGLPVYFTSFDVDDPSTDEAPVDPNGSVGLDNRGEPKVGTLLSQSAETDEDGKATVTFVVTMNLGDNFRAAASCNEEALNLVTQAQADANSPPEGVAMTDVLTVWRRLHVEFDTMEAPPEDEPFGTISGTSARIEEEALFPAQPLGWRHGSLNGGVLDPNGTTPPATVDYVGRTTWEAEDNDDEIVTVTNDYSHDSFDNDGANGADDEGETYYMTQVNPSSLPYGVNTDDPKWLTGLLSPTGEEAVAGMNGYYNAAYIECEAATVGNDHPSFSFIRNADDTQWNRNTPDVPANLSASYWAVAIAWCYENHAKHGEGRCDTHDRDTYIGDLDPAIEGIPDGPGNCMVILGVADSIARYESGPALSADVFVELSRDRGEEPADLYRTAAHELGHLLGLRHAAYQGSFAENDRGIMGWNQPFWLCMHDWFALEPWTHEADRLSSNNLSELRTYANPWP